MNIKKIAITLVCGLTVLSCNTTNKKIKTTEQVETKAKAEVNKLSKAQIILNETIDAHGGDLYNSAHYSFTFRNINYEFKNDSNYYEYKKKDATTYDILKNGAFTRTIKGKAVNLNEKDKNIALGAINSVIYFATLPYKLQDKAISVSYGGETIIQSKNYHVLEISFKKEGGGVDFNDEYCYWINATTKKIDYLAYNYRVNNGGVRFRTAYNVRVIDGITFQDYVNYKAEVGTLLKDLPALYESEKLEELSKIETENIINLNK